MFSCDFPNRSFRPTRLLAFHTNNPFHGFAVSSSLLKNYLSNYPHIPLVTPPPKTAPFGFLFFVGLWVLVGGGCFLFSIFHLLFFVCCFSRGGGLEGLERGKGEIHGRRDGVELYSSTLVPSSRLRFSSSWERGDEFAFPFSVLFFPPPISPFPRSPFSPCFIPFQTTNAQTYIF